MRKIIFALMFAFFLVSLVSSEIIINTQPNDFYNLGESFPISVTIKSFSDSSGVFEMDLICNGQSKNFYRNGIKLNAGEEKILDASLIFSKSLIGNLKGDCVIKGTYSQDYILTERFVISDKITLQINPDQSFNFKPGENYEIKGTAIKENGIASNGFVNLEIIYGDGSDSIKVLDSINNGIFSTNVSFPKNMEAKKYLMQLTAYEEEGNEKTNTGFLNTNIDVLQIPTSLELVVEKGSINPGEDAKVKTILHDQTGKNINAFVNLSIRNSESDLVDYIAKPTNEFVKITTVYNEKPGTWNVVAESNGLTTSKEFLILEKKDIDISLAGNIVTVKNIGNVFYTGTVTANVGEKKVFIDVALDVDKSEEYALSAPDGEYEVTLLDENGEALKQNTFLTGKVVSAEEKRSGTKFIFSFAWIFILLVLGLATYFLFKKNHKKTYVGYLPSSSSSSSYPPPSSSSQSLSPSIQKKKFPEDRKIAPILSSGALLPLIFSNKAEVSLSIKGDKQKATTTCVYIKNFKEIKSTKNNVGESIKKVIDFAERQKALIYENQDNIFFILSPARTKTFKNEESAFQIAQIARSALNEHNKLFKQKVDFGISINNGAMILKQEKDSAKFVGLGSFLVSAKKMASISNGEILFSEEVMGGLRATVKAEKLRDKEGIYAMKELRVQNEDNKKFIDNFVSRMKVSEKPRSSFNQ